MSTPPASAAQDRIIGFDVARAMAIFGMVVVNYRGVFEQDGTSGWLEQVADQVNGRAAALFVFLAGLGISLLSARSRASGEAQAIRADRITLFRRALFLFVLGLGFRQVWEFDILHFYGVYLAFAAILLVAPTRVLIGLALLAVAVFPLLYAVLPGLGIPFWDTTSAFTPRDIVIDLTFQGYHPVAPWLAFLLLGMVVGRLDLGDRTVRRRMLIGGVLAALLTEAISFAALGLGLLKPLLDVTPGIDLEAIALLLGTEPYPPMPLFVVVGTGWAMAAVSLCLAAGERWGSRRWMLPFAHAGQLALTVYILHGTIGVWAIAWLGMEPRHSLEWVLGYCVIFYVAIVLLATIWRRFLARGPVETVMRWLTGSRKSEIVPSEDPA